MKILVTGAAGFIGMHTVKRLLADGHEVIGLDNMNDYYDVSLKLARLSNIGSPNQFSFVQGDLADQEIVTSLFRTYQPNVVINLAAQAGVRFSLENPHSYIQANLVGFTNLLEACRHFDIQNLIFASSSSVYGLNKTIPFLEEHHANHPLSLYGATKKRMRSWRIPMQICSGFLAQAYDFSQFMVPGAGRICLFFYLLRQFWPTRR